MSANLSIEEEKTATNNDSHSIDHNFHKNGTLDIIGLSSQTFVCVCVRMYSFGIKYYIRLDKFINLHLNSKLNLHCALNYQWNFELKLF